MTDDLNSVEKPANKFTFAQKYRRTRLRFNIEDDLRLLSEVCSRNPHQDPSRWRIVQQNVASHGKAYSMRCIKEHIERLLKLCEKNDMESLCKVGTTQKTQKQFFEKTRLLDEIKRMQNSPKNTRQYMITQSEVVQNSMNISNSDSYKIDESDSTTDHVEEVDIKPPTITQSDMIDVNMECDAANNKEGYVLSRHVSPSVESYEDNEMKRRQLEFEERQLALEERKVTLEEKKFEIEREERLRRLDIEIKEREAKIKLEEQHQEIIKVLLNQYKRN